MDIRNIIWGTWFCISITLFGLGGILLGACDEDHSLNNQTLVVHRCGRNVATVGKILMIMGTMLTLELILLPFIMGWIRPLPMTPNYIDSRIVL